MEKIYTCNICGADSGHVPFYKGVTSRCKECHKARMKVVRAERADYYRDYDAKRFQDDPRVKERQKAYQKTDAGKAATQRSRKKWLAENPEKRAAHVILGSYVSTGRIDKPDVCSICGAGGRIDGHHHDYAKPLEVEWLCRKCHMQRHSNTETSAHEVKK
jgi:hypothetical protein